PNCAFHTQLPSPLDNITSTDDPQAGGLTGPEGYIVQSDGSTYHNNSQTHTDSSDSSSSNSTSFKVCGGVEVYANPNFFGEAGVKTYVSIEGCMAMDSTQRTSSSDASAQSQGAEGRTSMATRLGVRLPNTPFPSLPAGALVLVEMPRGATNLNQVSRVSVVTSGSTAFLMQADADVYLAVNDVGGCGSRDTSDQLTVRVIHTQQTNTNTLMNAMGDALATMRNSAGAFLAQGRILPDDMTSLRSAALVTLGNSAGSLGQ